MGVFNFFGEQDHKVFDYKPIYFDKEKDELKRKFGKVDGSAGARSDGSNAAPGSHIQGAFRDGNYSRTKSTSSKAQNIIGLVGLILVAVVLVYIAKFYTLL